MKNDMPWEICQRGRHGAQRMLGLVWLEVLPGREVRAGRRTQAARCAFQNMTACNSLTELWDLAEEHRPAFMVAVLLSQMLLRAFGVVN